VRTFTIEITPKALAEIDSTFAFISRISASAAERWYQRLRESIAPLQSLPTRCPLAPESEWYDGELRQLLQGKRPHVYRILFEIRGSKVSILRVRHGRQELLKSDEL